VIDAAVQCAGSPLADAVLTVWETQTDWRPGEHAAEPQESEICGADCSRPFIHAMLKQGQVGDMEVAADRAAARFCFPAAAAVFRGHFPGYPILPGIDILALAGLLCEQWCGSPVDLIEAEATKFLQLALPDEMLEMELTMKRRAERPDEIEARGRLNGEHARKAVLALAFRVVEPGSAREARSRC
jgi:3-hydroxyacyl-[acyl-carrier-protein] dehydratase